MPEPRLHGARQEVTLCQTWSESDIEGNASMLVNVTAEPGGDIQAQLDALSAGSTVDAELARMKAELGAGAPPPKEIPAGGESK